MKLQAELTHRLVFAFDAPVLVDGTGIASMTHSAAPRGVAFIAGGILLALLPLAGWLLTRSLVAIDTGGIVLFAAIGLVGAAFVWRGVNDIRWRWCLSFPTPTTVAFRHSDQPATNYPRSALKIAIRPGQVTWSRGLWRGFFLTADLPDRQLILSMHKKRAKVESYANTLREMTGVQVLEESEPLERRCFW